MTEEELRWIEDEIGENTGYTGENLELKYEHVRALIAEVRRLTKVDRAARFVLLEMRREFQRGDLIDVDELEEAINAAAEPSSPKP
jgi:predicted esterase YcpF (UPF0227 family)